MKRRSFLKGAAIAPMAASANVVAAAGKGNSLARFGDDYGSVVVNYIDKLVTVHGRPRFWSVYEQMADYEDEHLEVPARPFWLVSGWGFDADKRPDLITAELGDGWTATGLPNIHGAVFLGYHGFHFLATRHHGGEDERLYINGNRIKLNDQGLLIVEDPQLVLYRKWVGDEEVYIFDKSAPTHHQHWELKASALAVITAVPL